MPTSRRDRPNELEAFTLRFDHTITGNVLQRSFLPRGPDHTSLLPRFAARAFHFDQQTLHLPKDSASYHPTFNLLALTVISKTIAPSLKWRKIAIPQFMRKKSSRSSSRSHQSFSRNVITALSILSYSTRPSPMSIQTPGKHKPMHNQLGVGGLLHCSNISPIR